MSRETVIEVPILARVEGEGALDLRIKDGKIDKCDLRIYEPPRYFEKFLEGREPNAIIDAVARICGICPLAYQAGFSRAYETAFDITRTQWIDDMRLLMFLGEWIESHYLHVHLLAAPDFLGYRSAIEMAKDYPKEVVRGVKLQHLGNDILKLLGGRSVHPNGMKVGGFYKAPLVKEVHALIPKLKDALNEAKDVIQWVSTLLFPDTTIPFKMVSLSHPTEYPVFGDNVITSDGEKFHISEYDDHFREFHAVQSTALHSTTVDGQPILLGPLSRINLNFDKLPKHIQQMANATGVKWPSRNMFHSVVARAIEGYWAIERALDVCENYSYTDTPCVDYTVKAADAWGAVEAPRGIQIDHIKVNDQGLAEKIRISAPTSQNLPCIEADLRMALENFGLDKPEDDIRLYAEMVIRNYDPCISCSAHFLTLNIDRD
ncbi:Ni/Fe hydrogenase subunit alpha [Francisella sp. SYW-9]|uniref:Ni/Fe hydrogenase subunit alpha n=1 Tax=Francisella sp. SYW-9 TaxID=2610888 RepID=UPI00123D859D|nr:nickel-dependent hydrogenase large subunit [Francisella sp. SYW-9]